MSRHSTWLAAKADVEHDEVGVGERRGHVLRVVVGAERDPTGRGPVAARTGLASLIVDPRTWVPAATTGSTMLASHSIGSQTPNTKNGNPATPSKDPARPPQHNRTLRWRAALQGTGSVLGWEGRHRVSRAYRRGTGNRTRSGRRSLGTPCAAPRRSSP